MPLTPTIIFIACLLPLLLVGFIVATRQRAIHQLLRPLVQAYGATMPQAMFFRSIDFEVNDVKVTVRIARLGQKLARVNPYSVTYEFHAPLSDSAPNCQIRPLRFLDSVRRWVGQGLLTGENAFDDMFFVQGDDRDELHRVLDVQAQAALLSLHGGLRELTASNGQLRILATQPVLQLVSNALILLERFLGLTHVGVEFVDEAAEASGPVRICETTACPVCGDRLDAKIVYCYRCQVPHHRECWKYAGGCAIFACGSTKSSLRQRHRRRR